MIIIHLNLNMSYDILIFIAIIFAIILVFCLLYTCIYLILYHEDTEKSNFSINEFIDEVDEIEDI